MGDDYTEIGGTRGDFMTTHWSLVEKAGSPEHDKDRVFIGLLLNRYWKPVYCYLRGKGHDNEQAKDLTQGFFHEVVLERQLIAKADAAKGRFRSFLLIALDRYLVNTLSEKRLKSDPPRASLFPWMPPISQSYLPVSLLLHLNTPSITPGSQRCSIGC